VANHAPGSRGGVDIKWCEARPEFKVDGSLLSLFSTPCGALVSKPDQIYRYRDGRSVREVVFQGGVGEETRRLVALFANTLS